jgi:oxygen-independent coproporphyrinogen III oxidase
MPDEYLFDMIDKTTSEIVDQIIESEHHVPGLLFSYPPISTWKPIPEHQATPEALWADSDQFSHNLYIHIPFCRQKCSFCYYSVAVIKEDTDVIWEYLKCLELEAQRYRDLFADRPIETVFIGGGTPSRLNEAQIAFLFEKVIHQFDLSQCREISFECSPDSATPERIAAMKQHGTTRMSMGVQSLDADILRKARRGDDPDEVIATYYNMVDSGVGNVNIDLIAGIEKEALTNMERTMDGVAGLDPRPTQITLFTLSVRERSINHKTLASEVPIRLFNRSLALYRYAKRRMMDMGYWQYSRNLFPQPGSLFHYQDNHWGHNGYVLALGSSGYSHSGNWTYMNSFRYSEYMRQIRDGEPTISKAFPLNEEETKRRHLSLAMKHARLDVPRFNSFYGYDALSEFEPSFAAMEALGIIERDGHEVRYTPDYADLSDRFVRLFYSEQVNRLIQGGVGEADRRDAFSFTV